MINFIHEAIRKPAASALIYSIAIMVLSILVSTLGIFYGGKAHLVLMGFVVLSVVTTVLPFAFLRFYSFGAFAKMKEDMRTPVAIIFILFEIGFILTNLAVYGTVTQGSGGGIAVAILSLMNIIGIIAFGVISAVMYLASDYGPKKLDQLNRKFDEINKGEAGNSYENIKLKDSDFDNIV